MEKGQKRITIGVLAGGILDDFTKVVSRGVLRAAKRLGVNVVVLPGKYLDRDLSDNRELRYEYQYNTIFSYAEKEKIDALLVLAGSIGYCVSTERMKKMLTRYKVPCVLIASQVDGFVDVSYDNCAGVRQALEYLIKRVGCKKIGMIGGSSTNLDAEERKQTFFEVLREYGLPHDENVFVEGTLTRKNREIVSGFLDREPDLDAIFCVNDDTALGLYEELKSRGIQPGKDISVVGFDDVVAAARANPPIASVRADGAVLGEKALRMALAMLGGEKIESKKVPTRFILRDSVCQREEDGIFQADGAREFFALDNIFRDIFWRSEDRDDVGRMEQIKETMHALGGYLERQISEKKFFAEENGMQVYIDRLLNLGTMADADVENMLGIMKRIETVLKAWIRDGEHLYAMEKEFSLAYWKIIRAMDYENGRQREEQQTYNYSMKLFVRDMLEFENGNDQSYALILNNLEWLHIEHAFLYAFGEPQIHLFREEFEAPDHLYLKAAKCGNDVFAVPFTEQKTAVEDMLCNPYIQTDKKYSFVQIPLFYNESLYGVLLCDLTNEIFENGEFLVNQMSSAMRIIKLLKVNETIQQQLEESFEAMRENNVVLDTLSKSDGLTMTLNRRGFYQEAEKMLTEARESGKPLLVLYADMNNLKIINDRYGHENGDFSLKMIGRLLAEQIGEKGVAGRIGGDEFAGMLYYDEPDGGKSFLRALRQAFERENKNSDKPYNVTVSAGAVRIDPEEEMTLEEALAKADQKLYIAKQHRKKEVAK